MGDSPFPHIRLFSSRSFHFVYLRSLFCPEVIGKCAHWIIDKRIKLQSLDKLLTLMGQTKGNSGIQLMMAAHDVVHSTRKLTWEKGVVPGEGRGTKGGKLSVRSGNQIVWNAPRQKRRLDWKAIEIAKGFQFTHTHTHTHGLIHTCSW